MGMLRSIFKTKNLNEYNFKLLNNKKNKQKFKCKNKMFKLKFKKKRSKNNSILKNLKKNHKKLKKNRMIQIARNNGGTVKSSGIINNVVNGGKINNVVNGGTVKNNGKINNNKDKMFQIAKK